MKSWREIQAEYEHIEDMPPLDREVYEEAMELNRQERYERDHPYEDEDDYEEADDE